jgi:hypothetical protein
MIVASIVTLLFANRQGPRLAVHGFARQHYPKWNSSPAGLHPKRKVRSPRAITQLNASSNVSSGTESCSLEQVLQENGYGRRLLTISVSDLPVVAEVYSHGKCELCRIVAFEATSKPGMSPLILTEIISDENKSPTIIDLGQITTIWENVDLKCIGTCWNESVEEEMNTFPIQHCERAMQRLYNAHVGKSRSSTSGLTKKQISKIVQGSQDANMEDVLRKVIKAGSGMMRLVDSKVAMDYLYEDYPKTDIDKARRHVLGATALTNDAQLGGRFKRMPCMYVASEDNDGTVASLTLVNGGWLTVDQSVKAGTEARKFAERSEKSKVQLLTVADERIAHRLECLAMGEVFSWESPKDRITGRDEPEANHDLELDVREALKAMNLPVSPSGAQTALVRLGRWSEASSDRVKLEPWTESVLEASRSYKRMDQKRRTRLLRETQELDKEKAPKQMEGRVDLTGLPCICVDAKRTSFPDDAIGVRPRSSTGRKVIKDASKWEILVHITDVSDIYSPETLLENMADDLLLLQDAAARRGASRYDLPLGPLHLMPPTALEALALQTTKFDETRKGRQLNGSKKGVNRCVTLWAYIDERNGRLIDAGIERTLISVPISLSFSGASSLLGDNLDAPELKQAKAILAVAERNLNLWSAHRQEKSEAARKREDRLSAREMVAQEQGGRNRWDDGRNGFQRTRGHRTVDAALDLYGYAVTFLLRRARAPVPRSSGSGASRGGRVGTAPLRRYIDGIAQRQALAVLCGYGGDSLTKSECMAASTRATEAINTLSNIRATKKKGVMDKDKQREALWYLKTHLAGRNQPVPAISTGRENEVVISGIGATAKCKGVKGTLKPGDRVMVQIKKVDPERGSLSVVLIE